MGKRRSKDAAFTEDDDALLAELGVETEVQEDATYTAKQERIIAGFEDIQRFYREHDRLPQHGEGRDIFERLYAVRLDRIRASADCLDLGQLIWMAFWPIALASRRRRMTSTVTINYWKH